MKKIFYTIILITSLLSIQPISYLNAQNRASFGIAPKVEIPAGNRTAGTGAIIPGLLTNTAYICDALTNEFQRIHFGGPGTDSLIGYLTELYHGGEFANGNYYVVNDSNVLKTINLTNAQVTRIAPISGISYGYKVKTLAFKQPNGPMYAGATTGYFSHLYTINLTTAAAASIGNIMNCQNLACFAINCAGELYGIDLLGNNTIKIDTSTGTGTIIGNCGIDPNYDQACRFDVTSGTLYWFSYSNNSICDLRTINLSTGASTLITSWGPGHQITAFGFVALCPPAPSCDIKAGPFVSLPVSIMTGQSYNIKARITNIGSAPQTNIPVKFFVNGMQYGFTQIIPNLAPGTFDTNTLFSWTPTVNGPATLKICSALGCDTIRTNDTVSTTVTVGLITLFCDNFTNGSGNWNIVINSGICPWLIEDRGTRPYQMPGSAMGNVLTADSDLEGCPFNTTATLLNPLNCTSVDNVFVEFDNDFYVLPPHQDQAILDVSTNGGTTWINKFIWTTNHRNTHEQIMLPEANRTPNIKIRLTAIEPGWDWWWSVDNVCIKGIIISGLTQNNNNIPAEYSLSQNYPNPFNPSTEITYALPKACMVKLVVYDALGREVRTLVNEYKLAGSYRVTFDGTSFSSGLYILWLITDDFTDVKKMMLVK